MYQDWVSPWLQPTDDCVEIGCASGYFLAVIKDRVGSVAGLETHLELRQYCEQIGIPIHDRLEEMPEASVDRLFAFFVLEHLGEPMEFLAQARRVCRPGGSIMIVVPNVDDVLLFAPSAMMKGFQTLIAEPMPIECESLAHIARPRKPAPASLRS